jgi:hypothetical protein
MRVMMGRTKLRKKKANKRSNYSRLYGRENEFTASTGDFHFPFFYFRGDPDEDKDC